METSIAEIISAQFWYQSVLLLSTASDMAFPRSTTEAPLEKKDSYILQNYTN